jgi:hypothetical protein
MKLRALVVLLLTASAVSAVAQSYPPAFPRKNATKLLETDRFVVWDIVWPKGEPSPLHRHVYDQVGTYYAPGGRVITTPDGATRSAMTAVGALSGTAKGTTHIEEGTTDPPLRAVFIELKQEKGSGVPEASAKLAAFPRDGAKLLRDDERVAVWDYTWSAGPDAMRSYTRETVVIWLGTGRVKRTAAGGAPTTVDVMPGQTRRYMPGETETIEVLEGTPRAMVVAFK